MEPNARKSWLRLHLNSLQSHIEDFEKELEKSRISLATLHNYNAPPAVLTHYENCFQSLQRSLEGLRSLHQQALVEFEQLDSRGEGQGMILNPDEIA